MLLCFRFASPFGQPSAGYLPSVGSRSERATVRSLRVLVTTVVPSKSSVGHLDRGVQTLAGRLPRFDYGVHALAGSLPRFDRGVQTLAGSLPRFDCGVQTLAGSLLRFDCGVQALAGSLPRLDCGVQALAGRLFRVIEKAGLT